MSASSAAKRCHRGNSHDKGRHLPGRHRRHRPAPCQCAVMESWSPEWARFFVTSGLTSEWECIRGVHGGAGWPQPANDPPKICQASRAPRQDLRVMVGHYHHLRVIGQIDPHDRVRHRHQARPADSVSRFCCGHPGILHYRCSLNVLLCELGHQARQAHQGDVPTSRTDTQNVFLCRIECVTDTHIHTHPSPISVDRRSTEAALLAPLVPH